MEKEVVSIYTIAEEAGVSPATVSRVLTGSARVSEEKKKRVLELIEKYDFRPNAKAQGLSRVETKVIGLLVKDHLTCNPCVAKPDELMCNGCSACAQVCPYGAITYVDKDFRGPNRTTLRRRVAQVNPAVCQGCGACTVTCPSGAMDLLGFSNRQILAEVDAICK